MSNAGRPRKPTALKALQGTTRPDRSNDAEPEVAVLALGSQPPEWIKRDEARQAWGDLVRLLTPAKILTVLDPLALGLLVDAFADYLSATADVDEEGPYYWSTTEGGGKIRRRNPAMDDRKDAWLRVERMLSKFGMTPVDRAKVKVAAETEEDPFATWASKAG